VQGYEKCCGTTSHRTWLAGPTRGLTVAPQPETGPDQKFMAVYFRYLSVIRSSREGVHRQNGRSRGEAGAAR
jgi:hypothetical protein